MEKNRGNGSAIYGSPFETKGAKPSRSTHSQLQLAHCIIELINCIITQSNHSSCYYEIIWNNKSADIPCSASKKLPFAKRANLRKSVSDEIYRCCLEVPFTWKKGLDSDQPHKILGIFSVTLWLKSCCEVKWVEWLDGGLSLVNVDHCRIDSVRTCLKPFKK